MAGAKLRPMPSGMLGLQHSLVYNITEADVAFTQRSGGVMTLSTARLAELLERACIACVSSALEAGHSTAGCAVMLRHTAPMPVGASIRLAVSVTHALRRQLSFACEVSDAANPALVVASGTHQRVYIDSDAFDAALSAKAGETGVRVGLTGTSTHFVDVQHIASREVFGGPRSVEALSTSSLMAWAEEAAIAALEEHLPAGSTTVGGESAVAHVAPTPKGMQVTCRAVLTRISPTPRGALRLLFELSGEDRVGAVMTGTHLRFLVQRTDFERKARGVLMPDGRRRGSFAGSLPPALAQESAGGEAGGAEAEAASRAPLPGRPPLPGAGRPPAPASAVAMGGALPKLSLGGSNFLF